MNLLTILLLIFLGCILGQSKISLSYAALGLELWFQKMIPSLLPFMILSGVMVRLNLTEKAAMIIYPVIKPLYRVQKNVCYAMFMGFLCGFPMGARVVDDLYTRQKINRREAEYLLAFCNNIGPVYFCSFVLPLLQRKLVLPYLFGMYGIPLLYGLALRYTIYRDISVSFPAKMKSAHELVYCENDTKQTFSEKNFGEKLLGEVDSSIHASVQNILSLGGYMILFNLLNLIPHILLGNPASILSPLFEITGGLSILKASFPLYSLLALSFGGFSCIAQTYTSIADTDLSIGKYIVHKMILTLLNGIFYLCWSRFLPASFLR